MKITDPHDIHRLVDGAAFECPCCGAPMLIRPPRDVLRFAKLSPLARSVVDILARTYPRTLSADDLASLVYSDDPDGGPLGAGRSIACDHGSLQRRACAARMEVRRQDAACARHGVVAD